MKQLNNIKALKDTRKQLRANLTPAEAKLWSILKGKQLEGLKFRRQHSIGKYIVDFYCPQYLLAIELDGGVHDSVVKMHYDEERTKFLNANNIHVLRFRNNEVFENMDVVVNRIKQNCINKRF